MFVNVLVSVCVYIYIKSCIICQQHCHVSFDASGIVMSFDVGSVAMCHLMSAALSCVIWCQQCCHVSFDAPQKTKTNLRWRKTVFWQEVCCSHGDRTGITADECCHSIDILCVSSSDVILFMSCVSLHHMLSFYSCPVCLFIICCHSIHILCVSSSCVILFIICVSLHVSLYSYPVWLFICHSVHILCVHHINVMLPFITLLFCSYLICHCITFLWYFKMANV